MIITTNTASNVDVIKTNAICRCGHDYGGDRIILENSDFVPILGGERLPGLDLSAFYKNISQANTLRFKLNSKQSKVITDIDGFGVKFLAISIIDPAKPIYWRKKYEDPLLEYITAILNGSVQITAGPFTSDHVPATFKLILNSDNTFKTVTWNSIDNEFIDGEYVTKWNEAGYSWNDYHPLLTTNTKLKVISAVTEIPLTIEYADNGDYSGDVISSVSLGTSIAKFVFKFHGNYPGNTFIIDTLTIELDGHLVGALFIDPGTLVTSFSTPLYLTANQPFLAASGLLEEYDKIVGMMVLTTTDDEPLADIKLYNGGVSSVQVTTLIGS